MCICFHASFEAADGRNSTEIGSESSHRYEGVERPGSRAQLVLGVASKLLFLCSALAFIEPRSFAEISRIPSDETNYWAFQQPRQISPPEVVQKRWLKSPIDNFILAQLEARKLMPAAPADRCNLIRRASFDLIGLPPTPEEVAAFQADSSADAFAKVVDRLLASPAYGERWGRHWLDAVRYADARDLIQLPVESDFREAWRYRDWVVDAFNQDLPYPDFIQYQIAGDLMQPESPTEINKEALIATGLLAIADFVPGDVDKDLMIADYVNDQVDVVGRAFLGLTLGCARCHDHKFDPISIEDYYSLAGIFFSTRLIPSPVPGNTPLVRVPLLPKAELERIAFEKKHLAELESEIQQIKLSQELEYLAKLDRWATEQTASYLVTAWEYNNREQREVSLPEFAKQRGLPVRLLSRWLDYLGLREYSLCSSLERNAGGVLGLQLWSNGESLPSIRVNVSDAPLKSKAVTYPPRSIALSPSKDRGAAIGWKSPFTGTVRLSGRLADSGPPAGGEIHAAIDLMTAMGRRELAWISVPQGGSQDFGMLPNSNQLARLEVQAGDMIEVTVLPHGQTNGAALVELTITENGTDRHWSLAGDVADDFKEEECANPRADKYRNQGVWFLLDTGDVRRMKGEPSRLNPALAAWRQTLQDAPVAKGDRIGVERSARELEQALLAVHQQKESAGAKKSSEEKALANAELLKLQANDPQLITSSDGRVMLWPNRASTGRDFAAQVPGITGPLKTNAMIATQLKPVLRFGGKDLLEILRSVPPAGSLFIVFKVADASASGQRLVGWEDSSAGQHGLGLMPTPSGGLHAILRKNGANGDIVAVATGKTNAGFEMVSITWGSRGTTLHRDSAAAGKNRAIDSVSLDPAIKALKMGGPGSGTSARFRGDVAELRVYNQQLEDAPRAQVEAELFNSWLNPEAKNEAPPSSIDLLYEELISQRGPFWLEEEGRAEMGLSEFNERLANTQTELVILKKKLQPEIPQAVVVQDGGPSASKHEGFKDTPVFLRGNPKTPGEIVPRGFPRVLAGTNQPPIAQGSGRLQLARWIASAENPLTARVMVNRIWQHHFGEGIVRTATNFGRRGEPPTHPELLDYLAIRFVESGWSIKAMHRLIMLSAVYQQSCNASAESLAVDPENLLFSRMNRRRLEAEEIRDNLLFVSGRLDPSQRGPGFQEVGMPRRSLYFMSVRTGGSTAEFGSLFDRPDGGAIVEKRSASTVAPQALFWLNDKFTLDQANFLAERLARESRVEGNEAKIRTVYRILFGRAPDGEEMEIGLRLLSQPGQDALQRYCQILLCTNEFIYVD